MKYLSSFLLVLSSSSHGEGRLLKESRKTLLNGNDNDDRRYLETKYENIRSYTPRTLVTDDNAIDLDLRDIKNQFRLGTKSAAEVAERIYREGAHSRPVAIVNLDTPLSQDIPKGAEVTGVSRSSRSILVRGRTKEAWKAGDTVVLVEYAISADQGNHVSCQVGANPNPTLEGCLVDSGEIALQDQELTLAYQYDSTKDNVHFNYMESFSTLAQDTMGTCDGSCPYPEFETFDDYFLLPNYADHIITAAFTGSPTNTYRGDMNFSLYPDYARAAFLETAMPHISIWMWCLRQLNFAIDLCEDPSLCPDDDPFCSIFPGLHAWDKAVAYYTGSLSSVSSSGTGRLLYALADEQCSYFKTCSSDGQQTSGEAYVNDRIFQLFREGQSNILAGNCQEATVQKQLVASLMRIPLIQGTLRYSHLLAYAEEYDAVNGATGAAFALSVLPVVYGCDEDAASVIYENLKPQSNPRVDFVSIKRAFERSYKCMNITCGQVGGIYDSELGQYAEESGPCVEVFGQPVDDDDKQLALGLGISIAILALLGVFVCLVRRGTEKRIQNRIVTQREQNTLLTHLHLT